MPARARKEIVDPNEVAVYHVTNRCVRRAFLCGDDQYTGKNYDHRKGWIEELLKYMARYFALDIITTAIMSNHFHQELRTRPDLVQKWSDRKVAQHWLRLYPKRRDKNGVPRPPNEREIAMITNDKERVATLRERLSSLSWFQAYVKEKVARRANQEDNVTGHFWAERFDCKKLVDEAAAITCAIYIDLNPVRAGIAATPEQSRYTSAWHRIRARQARKARQKKRRRRSTTTVADDRWLASITDRPLPQNQCHGQSGHRISDDTGLPLSLDQYLQLLDWTGRQVRADKRGAIPAELDDILSRIDVEPTLWLQAVQNFNNWFGAVAGSANAVLAHAQAAGRRWYQGVERCRQFFRPREEA